MNECIPLECFHAATISPQDDGYEIKQCNYHTMNNVEKFYNEIRFYLM